jgi:glucose/arabinose dehydrogenase
MKRIELNRGLLVVLAVLLASLIGGCARLPVVYKPREQQTLDRRYVEYPTGFELKLAMANLTAPTAIAFDTDGTLLIAEGGIEGDEPRIFALKPDSATLAVVYPTSRRIPFSPLQPGFQIYGPIGGMTADQHRIFVSHRDKEGRGVITQFGYDGSHKTIVGDLPAEGDFGVTDLVVGPNQRLYFGVGSATNSGIVGLDNIRWLRGKQGYCDQSYTDLELLAVRFITKNPFAGLFGGSDIINTGAFQPFGVSSRAVISKVANGKPSASVCSVPLGGGDFQVEAYGVHLPRGLAFDSSNRLFVSNDGMELRGSRPVQDDPDVLLWIRHGLPPEWWGWPDYSANLLPITDKRFQPPIPIILPTGFPKLVFLIDHRSSELREIDDNVRSYVKATFPPLSGTAKLAFAPGTGPWRRWQGEAFIAQSGDRAPYATSGYPLKAPVGYKVVRVNPESRQVAEFIHNTDFLPASKSKHMSRGAIALERPIDVKMSPTDGSLYVLDFGEVEYKPDGREKIARASGKLFRLTPAAQPPQQGAATQP